MPTDKEKSVSPTPDQNLEKGHCEHRDRAIDDYIGLEEVLVPELKEFQATLFKELYSRDPATQKPAGLLHRLLIVCIAYGRALEQQDQRNREAATEKLGVAAVEKLRLWVPNPFKDPN